MIADEIDRPVVVRVMVGYVPFTVPIAILHDNVDLPVVIGVKEDLERLADIVRVPKDASVCPSQLV